MDLFDIVVARKLSGGGGGSWTVLTEETVTTSAQSGMYKAGLSYSQPINANTIRVTFNGTEYECPQISMGDGFGYGGVGQGGLDFTEYPFVLLSNSGNTPPNEIYTESAGTYTIKIEAPQSGSSSDFSTAEVTVVNPNTVQVEGFYASVFEDGEMAVAYLGDSSTYPVVIYKEGIYLQYNGATISVSGNAELYSDRYIYVTGDCTITIS